MVVKSAPILDGDNVGTMFEKLAQMGASFAWPAHIAGEIKPVSCSRAITFFMILERGRLDWNKSRLVTSSIKSISFTVIPMAYSMTVNVSKFMRRTWQGQDRLVSQSEDKKRVGAMVRSHFT